MICCVLCSLIKLVLPCNKKAVDPAQVDSNGKGVNQQEKSVLWSSYACRGGKHTKVSGSKRRV